MFTKENAKKILVLLLTAVMLIVSCAVGYCESDDEIYSFDPMLTNIMETTAEEWFATSGNRALLTALIAGDLTLSVDETVFDMSSALIESSFVGKDEEDLFVAFHAVNKDLIVIYTPSIGLATYFFTDPASDAAMESALGSISPDGCYQNDSAEIFAAVQELSAILSSL